MNLIILHLIISILLILILIMLLKLNAGVALIIGAIYLSIASGLENSMEVIARGFGNILTTIGLPICFGVIIGKLLAESGGVEKIARTLIALTSKRERTPYAIGLTAFISAIPVFYDVVYVILAPIAKKMSKVTKIDLPYFFGFITIGGAVAHCFIPPTPGPLAGAAILGVDIGAMILWGIIIGFPTALITYLIYSRILKISGFWKPETDIKKSIEEKEKEKEKEKKLPNFGISLIPIFLPLGLISLGTITQAIIGYIPPIIGLISHQIFAMLAGVLAAYILALKVLSKTEVEKAISGSMGAAGTIILITGAGGSLAAVIEQIGISEILLEVMRNLHLNPIIFVWLVAAVLGGVQGSHTVSLITALSLVVPIIPGLDVSPLYIVFAAASGAEFIKIVNDSGFWVSTLLANFTVKGGIKVYSLTCSILSAVSLGLILFFSIIFPNPI